MGKKLINLKAIFKLFFTISNINLKGSTLLCILLCLWERELLGSISPTFYEQLLNAQIPKEQNKSSHQSLFALLRSAFGKAVHKKVVKLTPEVIKFSNDALFFPFHRKKAAKSLIFAETGSYSLNFQFLITLFDHRKI